MNRGTVITTLNEEEKSRFSEYGKASPDGESGHGQGTEVHF
jgi:hypothetical protein